jgi:ABC-type glycerol-3-phosphate transport system substrate-binding protein
MMMKQMKLWTLASCLALVLMVCGTTPVFSADTAAAASTDTATASDAKQTCDNPNGEECAEEAPKPKVRVVTEEELAS